MNPFSDIIVYVVAFLAGLASTLLMTLYEIPIWKRFGLKGVLEWHENQVLSTRFFRLSESDLHIKGIFLLHFANGGLGGVGFVFALMIFPITTNTIVPGIAYGVFLWIVTLVPIHKPITGITPWRHPDGMIPMIASLIGHLIYGVTLGMIFWLVPISS
ncbi:MAG: hypothetical protein EB150_02580 [Nitrososphaeria archaeon]|nr:hypothetical protein [Nitrososphaeria archaeon]